MGSERVAIGLEHLSATEPPSENVSATHLVALVCCGPGPSYM